MRQREFHVVVFCLGLLLFSWPVVSASNLERISSTFIYLFLCWALVLVLQFLISRCLDSPSPEDKSDDTER